MTNLSRVDPREESEIMSGLDRASGLRGGMEGAEEDFGEAEAEERARTLRMRSEASREILTNEDEVSSSTGVRWLQGESDRGQ